MSKSVSALDGEVYAGFVEVKDLGLRGMVTVRGDLSSRVLQKAVTKGTKLAFPERGMCSVAGDFALAWMSPDELLLMMPYDVVDAHVAELGAALAGEHALVANVSDARSVVQLHGAAVRDVLAKLSPADVSCEALSPFAFRRSRMAQVPAAFWLEDEETAYIICFRSVSSYLFNTLCRVAEPGSEVGYFQA